MKVRIWKLLGLIFMYTIFALSATRVVCTAGTEGTNLTVIATVPVGLLPTGVAYDPAKGEIFVTNRNSRTVSIISDSTYTVVATIPVRTNPEGMAYDPVRREIFVANQGSGTVSVISDSTNTVVATVPVGSEPWGIAYDSGKGEIFVANGGSGTVSVLLASSNLAAPIVSVSQEMVDQGQTSTLTSTEVTTGIPPYTHQWFSKAPGDSSYTLISGAIQSIFNFATSASTATGNWSFIIQVTDKTGASVNSTATSVTVNTPTNSLLTTVYIVVIPVAVVVVAVVAYVFIKRNRSHLLPPPP